MSVPLTFEEFQAASRVSRETMERLSIYADLLCKWQKSINLVSSSTLEDLWRRHFLDSAQLWTLLPQGAKTLVDMGSGAGFPGMVLAIMGVDTVHLIESDQRKCAFLREVARETGISVTVHATRIETATVCPVDVVTSRALASLDKLLDLSSRFRTEHTICLFPKGQTADIELTGAQQTWTLRTETFPSLTDANATILRLSEVRREL